MELLNCTNLQAGYTMATDKTGREWLVFAAKGTFSIPDHPSLEVQPQEEQVSLVMTDVFTGEPGFSAPLYEIDFALRKPRCDVLLNGSCYAPNGKPTKVCAVGLRVDTMTKSFNVVGHRVWKPSVFGLTISSPTPFTIMPLSYNNAYGGVDKPDENESTHQWYQPNPVGIGYHPKSSEEILIGKKLPNTEEIGQTISSNNINYKPMAFGPIGRSWQQRIKWAGTYDQKWMDNKFPFLPDDFDDRYFQCAPDDQQMDYLKGGEHVILVNLTPSGRTEFKLPALNDPFEVQYKNGDTIRIRGNVDTLVIEPDLGRFMLTMRASLQLRRNLHEISSVTLGRALIQPVSDEDDRKVVAKPHFRSLAELVEANRAKRKG